MPSSSRSSSNELATPPPSPTARASRSAVSNELLTDQDINVLFHRGPSHEVVKEALSRPASSKSKSGGSSGKKSKSKAPPQKGVVIRSQSPDSRPAKAKPCKGKGKAVAAVDSPVNIVDYDMDDEEQQHDNAEEKAPVNAEAQRAMDNFAALGYSPGQIKQLLGFAEANPPEEEEEDPYIEMTEEQQVVADALTGLGFEGPCLPDPDLMTEMGIDKEFSRLAVCSGVALFMNQALPTYPAEAVQFLATLQLQLFRPEDERYEKTMGGFFTFIVDGVPYKKSLKRLHRWFGFPRGESTHPSFDQTELEDVWYALGGRDKFVANRAKGTNIRHPAITYFRRALAESFFSRDVTTPVAAGEIHLLTTALKHIIKQLPNGRKLEGDYNNTGLGVTLLRHLLSYQTKVFTPGEGKKLRVGGAVSSILELCEVPHSKKDIILPESMNFKYLVDFRIIDSKRLNGKIVYKFVKAEKEILRIVLPCPRFTTLTVGNISFIPPRSALLTAAQTAAKSQNMSPDRQNDDDYVPPKKDKAKKVSPKSTKAKDGPSSAKSVNARAAPAVEPDFADDFDFDSIFPTPYEEKRISNHVKEAHSRIVTLGKVNRWLVKKWRQFTSKEAAMEKRLATLESRFGSSSNQPPTTERRHSVSENPARPDSKARGKAPPRRSAADAEPSFRRAKRKTGEQDEGQHDSNDEAFNLFKN